MALSFRSMSFLCLFFVTNYSSSPPPACLAASPFPSWRERARWGPRSPESQRKAIMEDMKRARRVGVCELSLQISSPLSVCEAVTAETTPSRRSSQIRQSCCQQIVCLEVSIVRRLQQHLRRPTPNCVNNN